MRTSYPIFLAHGIFPFHHPLRPFRVRDNDADDRFHYFRKIRSTLRANGFEAFHTRVSWSASLERRAEDLRNEILRLTRGFEVSPKVHLIAHSMGGLDARAMIRMFRMERRVASLTTIGTPHHGTAYADWCLQRFGRLVDAAGWLHLGFEGVKQLTRDSCLRLNALTRHFEENNGVRYQTVAGVQPADRVFFLLRPSYRIVLREEGENDGLVSVKSAAWRKGLLMKTIDADHLNQIGWYDRGEAKTGVTRDRFEQGIREVYLEIARTLSDG